MSTGKNFDQRKSSLPFGVHCFPRANKSSKERSFHWVFIAFRPSLLSPLNWRHIGSKPGGSKSSLPFGVHCFPRNLELREHHRVFNNGLHCLSAFTAFPAKKLLVLTNGFLSLHCLSAFTAFPALTEEQARFWVDKSSLPFGVHCFPRQFSWLCTSLQGRRVFIAFRRSLLSPPQFVVTNLVAGSTSSLPFGVHCFPRAGNGGAGINGAFMSSLPFGVHCFPRAAQITGSIGFGALSSLPFGVHCFPRAIHRCGHGSYG